MSSPLRLVVGLGNPGRSYAHTRHNAGAWFVQALAESSGASFQDQGKFQSSVARMSVASIDIRLVLPQTFMNLSGEAVAALARFYRIAVSQILVAHDELDLKPGVVKLKRGGGTAGHNGLRNIAERMGDGDFWRLRFGIGHPRDSAAPEQQVVDYVLQVPAKDEKPLIDGAIKRALAVWPLLEAGDTERAMHSLHTAAEASSGGGTIL